MSTQRIILYIHVNHTRRDNYLREKWPSLRSLGNYVYANGEVSEHHLTIDNIVGGWRHMGRIFHHWKTVGNVDLSQKVIDELNAKRTPHPLEIFEELGT